jgi:AraC-like DNA-binding protein
MALQSAGDPDGSGKCGARGELVAGNRMTLGFRHLDVKLAIETEGSGPSGFPTGFAILDIKRLRTEFAAPRDGAGFLQATDKPGSVEDILHAPAVERSRDPVVKQLSSALAAAGSADGRHTEICADAMRLALVARLLCLQFEAQQPIQRGDDDPTERQMRALQKWRLKRVAEYVDEHLSDKITLSDLATAAGLSRMHFAAQFRAATNLRPHEYLLRRRIKRAEELLGQSTMTLVEIALTVGFQTQAHFTTVFKRFVGDTPYQWRSRAAVYVKKLSPSLTADANYPPRGLIAQSSSRT